MKVTELVLRSRLVQKAIKESQDKAFDISSGYTFPGAPRTSTNLKAASLKNTAYVCMAQRAKRFAAPENYIVKRKEKITDHWFYDLIADPNYHTKQTWIEIKELISYWLDWRGNAYLWMPTYNLSRPVHMWLLPSDNVKILKADDTFVEGYQFTGAGGKKYILPKEEVCHFRTLMPSADLAGNFLIGVPKIVQAVNNMILADEESGRYMKEYFERDAIPPLVMSYQQKLTPNELKETKAHWNDALGQDKIKAIIDKGGQVNPLEKLTSTGTDNFVKTDKTDDKLEKAIHRAFEVPKALTFSDAANYATMKEIIKDFMINVIDPMINNLELRLTMHLIQYDPDIEIKHDKTESEDKVYSFKTANEHRVDNGLTKHPNGEVLMTPKDLAPLIIPSYEEEPLVDELEEDEKMISAKGIDEKEKQKVAYWKSFNSISLRSEKRLKKSVSKVFDKLRKEILSSLSKQYDWIGLDTKSDSVDLNLFDLDEWNKTLDEETEVDRKLQATQALKESLKAIKEQLEETDFEKEVVRRTKLSTSKISDSLNKIDKDLKAKILQILEENPLASEAEIREIIIDAVDAKFQTNYLEARASNIATTTSTFITTNIQHGTFNMFKRKYTWLSRRDSKVRTSHAKMDGKKPNRKGYFNVNGDKMRHPTGGSKAKENCKCRCQLHPEGKK